MIGTMNMNRAICRKCKYCPHVLYDKSTNRIFIICNRGYLGFGRELIVSEINNNLYEKISRYMRYGKNAKTKDRNLLTMGGIFFQDQLDNILKTIEINRNCPFYPEQLMCDVK